MLNLHSLCHQPIGSLPFRAPPHSEEKPLARDKGDFYRDPNAARYPCYPIDPALRFVLALNTDLDFAPVNFMA